MALSVSIKLPRTDARIVSSEFDAFRKTMLEKSKEVFSNEIQTELTNRHLRVEGHLSESWEFEIVEFPDFSSVKAVSGDVAASALEYGTVPAAGGVVNAAEMLEWILTKPVVPKYGTPEQFAWALAKRIGREGLPLHGRGLKRPFANVRKRAQRRINKQWENGITELVGKLNNGG